MEEILASIRRIIADDQSLPKQVRVEIEARSAEEARPAVHILKSEEEGPALEAVTHDTEESAMTAQGLIAAPQFASPEGPSLDVDPSPRPSIVPPVADVPADEAPQAASTVSTSRPDEVPMQRAELSIDVPTTSDRNASSEPAAALLSAATDNAVASAFNVLAASRLADNSTQLLDMTREMVRPLLRTWLDDNLPALVERLVRDEIERVARGGR